MYQSIVVTVKISKMTKFSDHDRNTIQAICAGGAMREMALQQLYLDETARKFIINLVLKHGGSLEDAKDVFQEAVILLDRKIRNEDCEILSSVRGYLCGLARHIWYNHNRKKMRAITGMKRLEASTQEEDEIWKKMDRKELQREISSILDMLSEREKRVLQMWQLSYSMKEIKETLRLPSAGMARKLKFNALDKLRKGLSPSSLKSLRGYVGN